MNGQPAPPSTDRRPSAASCDVAVIGGGPAGLSAALILARARRRVFVIDANQGRNQSARALHGFLTRDGQSPARLRAIGRREARRFGAHIRRDTVAAINPAPSEFTLSFQSGGSIRARKILLATGLVDHLPSVPGFAEHYGKCIHHCPFCDGWENRDRRLVALGDGPKTLEFARQLTNWSKDVVACIGPAPLSPALQRHADESGIRVNHATLLAVRRDDAGCRLAFSDGSIETCDAVFYQGDTSPRSDFHMRLRCRLKDDGEVWTDEHQRTSVPGVYLAGDASKRGSLIIMAAAEGAIAAMALHHELEEEDRRHHRSPKA